MFKRINVLLLIIKNISKAEVYMACVFKRVTWLNFTAHGSARAILITVTTHVHKVHVGLQDKQCKFFFFCRKLITDLFKLSLVLVYEPLMGLSRCLISLSVRLLNASPGECENGKTVIPVNTKQCHVIIVLTC